MKKYWITSKEQLIDIIRAEGGFSEDNMLRAATFPLGLVISGNKAHIVADRELFEAIECQPKTELEALLDGSSFYVEDCCDGDYGIYWNGAPDDALAYYNYVEKLVYPFMYEGDNVEAATSRDALVAILNGINDYIMKYVKIYNRLKEVVDGIE